MQKEILMKLSKDLACFKIKHSLEHNGTSILIPSADETGFDIFYVGGKQNSELLLMSFNDEKVKMFFYGEEQDDLQNFILAATTQWRIKVFLYKSKIYRCIAETVSPNGSWKKYSDYSNCLMPPFWWKKENKATRYLQNSFLSIEQADQIITQMQKYNE